MLTATTNASAAPALPNSGQGGDGCGAEPLYCRHCGFVRPFLRQTARHRRHFAATVLTLGLWGIGWLVAILRESSRPWCCTVCQARYTAAWHGARPSASGSTLRFRKMSVRLLAR